MRFLCEIFILAGLIYLGWDTPFAEWTGYKHEDPALKLSAAHATPAAAAAGPAVAPAPAVAAVPVTSPTPVVVASPQPTPPRAGSWMFDPSHRGSLDRPLHGSPHP